MAIAPTSPAHTLVQLLMIDGHWETIHVGEYGAEAQAKLYRDRGCQVRIIRPEAPASITERCLATQEAVSRRLGNIRNAALPVGCIVDINEGTFAGMAGRIEHNDAAGFVAVLLSVFGRAAILTLDAWMVSRATDSAAGNVRDSLARVEYR